MRMWMVEPKYLCRKHLLGNHNEIHKHKPSFEKQHSIKGRLYPIAQIEPMSMKKQHDELAEEMLKRGYNHKSSYKMPDLSYLSKEDREIKVDVNKSIIELIERCPECRERLRNYPNINVIIHEFENQ
jgi:hypothetical protein